MVSGHPMPESEQTVRLQDFPHQLPLVSKQTLVSAVGQATVLR